MKKINNIIRLIKKLFTFHLDNKHKLNVSIIYKEPRSFHEFICDCGIKIYYFPNSDIPGTGVLVDENSIIYRYYKYE